MTARSFECGLQACRELDGGMLHRAVADDRRGLRGEHRRQGLSVAVEGVGRPCVEVERADRPCRGHQRGREDAVKAVLDQAWMNEDQRCSSSADSM